MKTVEEGDIASFVVQDLGLTLAAKTCPDQSQAFERSIMVGRFRRKKSFLLFSERASSRYPKAPQQNVSRK